MSDVNQCVAIMFESAAPVFAMMTEMNAGVMKITPEIKGKKPFSIILVRGEEEVADIIPAVEAVEARWEKEGQ